ncbi:UNVERIFIED_CONTAM: DUF4445 domain-containing protein [Clostridioides difficile]|uniref:ASKHA domain-containing protein n=1 Tax=Clostridioides difficile TaxID=1496 RepID=UPI0008257712|nr:ASKHA domain-containing protein [Clostridioides difficile]MDO0136281.1 DUF4445 domain-containing protein [Clostridioides difficile]MDX5649348.1 ASKHA domain-containing protein [Clostridioides difficile]HBG7259464.1 DUF4445 domain-containing protein [Clostridioides difficile]HBY2627062.1 DUF4445 domain-containing protein [Clostridioides difficile]HBY3615736.1 DUF4445 domain-containing protein [Clostridioides difficile]
MLKINPSDQNTLLKCMRDSGALIESPCNGNGTCGKCKIRINSGKVTPITDEERVFLSEKEIENNIRLACFTVPMSEVEVDTLELSVDRGAAILNSDEIPDMEFSPKIKVESIFMEKTSLEKQESLEEKLNTNCTLQAFRKLPLYQNENVFVVKKDNKIIDVRRDNNIYGVAVDIGTTTVAVSLINLVTGEVESGDGFINPQKSFGLDVLSRIHYGMENKDGVSEMQRVFIEKLQNCIENLSRKTGIDIESVYEVVLSGNSTMIHIVLGVPLNTLGKSPYSSVFNSAVNISAYRIGLHINEGGDIYCIPSVSTYIGGDIVSGVLASGIYKTEKTVLFIDIGTNGEMVLSYKGRMYSCSCAAGPALEGMNISCGMRAKSGAIEGIEINGDDVKIKVIGDSIPKGICGSGILEGISQGVKNRIIAKTGRLSKDSGIVETDSNGKRRMCIDKKNDIYITQSDIRQVQLCKGAILSGIVTLINHIGIKEEDVDKVIVAGQFGKHLKPESITGTGLIPMSMREKIMYIGNSSMLGAKICLMSTYEREKMENIANNISYIELSTCENYEKIFTKCLQFGGI